MARIETAFDIPAASGTESPSSIEAHTSSATRPQSGVVRVSEFPQGRNLLERSRWVQTAIELGFVLADSVLLQHAADLTQLMEQAWECFLDTGNDFARDRALRYMRQRDAARRLLSLEWQQEREAQVLAACGVDYFIDEGDKAREQIAANEGAGK